MSRVPVRTPFAAFGIVLLISSSVVAQEWTATLPAGPSHEAPSQQASPHDQEQERPRWRFRWDDHPSLRFGDHTRIDFRARFQVHLHDSEAPRGESSGVDLARRRVGVDGRIADVVDFQIEGEIADDDPWRDVYVDYRQFTSIRVQAGKFKLPFSLDENTSPTDLDFVYRSLAATHLAPGRDRGVMVHGRVVDEALRYELGWFNHDGRNARTDNPERVFGNGTIAGRLTLLPFRATQSRLRGFQAAVAWTDSDVPEGQAALRGRTAFDASFFPPEMWVQGRRHRVGFEARWEPGPLSLKAEYIRAVTERRGQSIENTDLPALVAAGWYISGTYVLTGENKAGGLDRPRRSVWHGGPGAIELAGRLEAIAFRSASDGNADVPSTSPRAETVLGNRDRAATFGVNWYPLRGIKIQGNLIRETLTDPEQGPLPSKPAFWSGVVRLQLSI